MTRRGPVSVPASTRRPYLDWLRGIAVLLMILAHLVDAWTRTADRQSIWFAWTLAVGGMGSTLFLLLAGVAVSLSAGSKARRWHDDAAASRAVVRRGLQIFALAFLFRLQAWLLGWSGNPYDLLRVDVLNVMGPSIVCAAFLWRVGSTPASRCILFAAASVASSLLTPLIRRVPLGAVPDPLEAYIVPVPGMSNFVFFPWIGFVFAGASFGAIIDAAAPGPTERRVACWLAAAGAALAATAFAASYLPSPYARSVFWTSSPSFFFIRLGLALVAIGAAYLWYSTVASRTWSPVLQLGRTSLFIYWIHVEMVYGLVSRPLHRALGPPDIWLVYAVFSVFLLACSVAKDRIVTAIRGSSWRTVPGM